MEKSTSQDRWQGIAFKKKGVRDLTLYLFAILLCFSHYRVLGQCGVNAVNNGNFSDGLNGWTNPGGWVTSTFGGVTNSNTASGTYSITQNISNVYKKPDGTIDIKFSFTTRDFPDASNQYGNWSQGIMDVQFNGVHYMRFTNAPGTTSNVAVALSNGAQAVVTPSTFGAATQANVTLTIPYTAAGTTASGLLAFQHKPWATYDRNYINNVFVERDCSPPTPFSCGNNVSYITRGEGPTATNRQTMLYTFNAGTGIYTSISPQLIPGTLNTNVQAIGYNALDNFIWGSRYGTGDVVKIGANGQAVVYPVAGLSAGNYTAGDVDGNGILYLYVPNETTIYKVDLKPASGPVFAGTITLNVGSNLPDFSVKQDGTRIYGVSAGSGRLVTYTVSGATATLSAFDIFTTTTGLSTNAFLDEANNKLYVHQYDVTGNTYQIDLSNPAVGTTHLVSSGGLSTTGDGAKCPNASLFTLSSTQPSFYCSPGVSYLFQQRAAGTHPDTPTIVYRLDLQAGTISVAKDQLLPGTKYTASQAYAWNPTDSYMWGYRSETNQLIRVGRDWSVEYVTIPGLTILDNQYNGADIGVDGIMYLYRGGTTSPLQNGGAVNFIRRIDLNPASPTYLTALPDLPLNFSGVSQATQMLVIDWGYNPVDGNLYGVNNLQQVIRIRLSDGLVTNMGSTGISTANPYGAVYFDNNGTLFISANFGGQIYQIPNVVAGQTVAQYMIQGPITSQNDGARCYSSAVFTARIRGTVWNDANGDALRNGIEPALNTGTTNENGLWANLLDAAGRVVSSEPVSLDGSYTLYTDNVGTYSIALSTSQQVPGSILPGASVNNPWYFTGTNRSNANPNAGNQTGAIQGVQVTAVSNILDSFDFGIQQPPVADSYEFVLDQAPVSGSTILLNGSWPVSTSPTQLSGGDFEDGIYDGNVTTGAQTVIRIISEPVAIDGTPSVQPELFYDGVQLSAGDLISNYDQSKLEVKLNGVGYKGFQFTYKTIDAAGAESNTATYKVTWATALPVKLINFTAVKEGNIAQISWSTTEETNSDRFEIERSEDAKSWIYIGEKSAMGESKATLNYNFADVSPLSGNNYYRLKMIDKDDTYTFSRIQGVSFDQAGLKLMLHPNPVSDILFVKDADGHSVALEKVREVSILNTQGAVVYKSTSPVSSDGINVSGLATGIYVVKITLADGTLSTHKVIVGR